MWRFPLETECGGYALFRLHEEAPTSVPLPTAGDKEGKLAPMSEKKNDGNMAPTVEED